MKRILALVLVFVLVLAVFTGCSNNDTDNGDQGNNGNQVDNGNDNQDSDDDDKFGGTLTIGTYADPDTLNPLVGNDIAGSWVLNLVYPTLMSFDEAGNKVPYIIEEPEISEDGMTVTVRVLEGLKWQDGTPITSRDIDYTYTVMKEENLQWQAENLQDATWETPDDRTIVFTLSEPFPTFITTMGYWQRIVPAHIWEEVEDVRTFANDDPVGFGPFKFAEIARGQHYILERVDEFQHSPEGKPYLEKVVFKPYPDINTMVLALKSGDIDLTAKEIPAPSAAEFEGDPNYVIVENQDLGYEHLAINLTDPILKDVNVRTAIAMAVNRDEVVNFAFDGSAAPMPGIISPVYEKWQIGNDLPSYDVEGAKKVLADAGYVDTNNDGIVNAPNGEELSFEMMFANSVTTHEKVSRVIAENLKAIGIEAVPQPMDKSLQTDKLYNRQEWQLTINTWGAIDDVESSMSTLFYTDAALNWMQWSNPVADEAMDNMKSAVAEEDIMTNMDIFQKEAAKDLPDIPLVVKKNNFVYNSKFEGFMVLPSTLEGIVHPRSLAQVYINE